MSFSIVAMTKVQNETCKRAKLDELGPVYLPLKIILLESKRYVRGSHLAASRRIK